MATQFACPSCGAPLDYDGSGNPSMRCPFCGNSVVVPQELRVQRPKAQAAPRARAPASASGDSAELKRLITQGQRLRHVRNLMLAGKKDEAIQQFQEITGMGPEDAQQAVEAMASGKNYDLPGMPGLPAQRGGDGHAALIQVNQLLHNGQEAEAARVFDSAFHVGQQSAREAVRAIQGAQAMAAPPVRPTSAYAPAHTPPMLAHKRQGINWGLVVVFLLAFGGMAAGIIIPLSVGNGPLHPLFAQLSSLPVGFAHTTLTFGAKGTGNGYFTDAQLVAVDSAKGDIYVAEDSSGRIQVFDSQGNYLRQFQVSNSPKEAVRGLAVGGSVVYAADNQGQLHHFDAATGNDLGLLDNTAPDGTFGYTTSLAATPDGGVVAVVNNEAILRFNSQGKQDLAIVDAVKSVTDDSELEAHVAVDGEGRILIVGAFNSAVLIYSPQGKYLSRFGSEGDSAGQFSSMEASAIAVDNQGRIYVSDRKGIQVFDPSGRYLDVISVDGQANGLAFDNKNHLYAVTDNQQVIRYALLK